MVIPFCTGRNPIKLKLVWEKRYDTKDKVVEKPKTNQRENGGPKTKQGQRKDKRDKISLWTSAPEH